MEAQRLATIHKRQIGNVPSLNPGETFIFKWNNPPWATALSYFAYPDPPAASGPHGSRAGTVEITRITCTHRRDNDDGDKQFVEIHVKNIGDASTGFDLYQSWLTD
jgi:hypothetical protein